MIATLFPIVARLKGLGEEIKRTRHSKKLNPSTAQIIRRTLATDARHTGLTYGLVRGVPYHVIELKCKEPPSIEKIARMLTEIGIYFAPRHHKVKDNVKPFRIAKLVKNQAEAEKIVAEWMGAPVPNMKVFEAIADRMLTPEEGADLLMRSPKSTIKKVIDFGRSLLGGL
jgi:hypothetical protein